MIINFPLIYMPPALLFLELLESLELLVMAPLVALKQLPDRSHIPAVFAASEFNKCSPTSPGSCTMLPRNGCVSQCISTYLSQLSL